MQALLIFDLSHIGPRDPLIEQLTDRIATVIPSSQHLEGGVFLLSSAEDLAALSASITKSPLGAGKFPYFIAHTSRVFSGWVTAVAMTTPSEL
jgi:hypothetical protein